MNNFFYNKKVFITGHTGFKGSWLTTILSNWGAIVKGYALKPQSKDDFYIVNEVNKKCSSVIADINNLKLLEKEVLAFEPQFIFHLAAQPLVRDSYDIPIKTWNTNVMGTANLLNSVYKLEKKEVVIAVTTDKVYLNKEQDHPYNERDQLGGVDPYSASKASCELLISSYRDSFYNNTDKKNKKLIASVRAGNVIGGGDWSKDRLIPDIIRALQNNELVKLRNPDAVRPWQHVLEPLSGYLKLAKKLYEDENEYVGAWNFGPYHDESMSVLEVVKNAIDILGIGKYSIEPNETLKPESKILKLDISKAVNQLGWKPKLNTIEALKMTLMWYKKYYENQNSILNLTDKVIQEYFE